MAVPVLLYVPWNILLKVVTMLVTFVMVLLPATVAKGAIFFIVAQTNPKLVCWFIVVFDISLIPRLREICHATFKSNLNF